MHRAYAPLLACLAVTLLAAGPARAAPPSAGPPDPADPAVLEAFLDDFFSTRMAELDVPGAAFVLVKDGEIVLAKGYGYADLEREIPVDPRTTIFRIGSASKLFTATAVMQLVEQGTLDLHTDVNRYLDRFQIPDTYPQPVTLAHLLTHTGGFDDRLIGAFARTPDDLQPLGAYLAQRMPDRVMPPGEVTSYSNHGMALAGYLVEAASGMPFETYVAENILDPLGMARSTFAQPLPSAWAGDLAVPYPTGEEPGPMSYTSIAPAGMLSTTAHDMARFLIAHLQNGTYRGARILEPETVRLMHERHFANHPDIPGWAYGFTERVENRQRVLDHGGADPTGYGSMVVLLPEQNLGFFAVTNTRFREELLMALPEAFLDRYNPGETPKPASPEPLPGFDARAETLTGTYLTNRHARKTLARLSLLSAPPVRVRTAQGAPGVLTVTGLDGAAPTRWVEIEPFLFRREGAEARIAFEPPDAAGKDADGAVAHLFARERTPGTFDRAAWYETPRFHQALVGICVLIFLTVAAGWPLAALVRRLSDRPASFAPVVQQARGLALGVGALDLTFLVLILVATSTQPLQFGVPASVKALLILPLLTTAMTAALPWLGARAWSAAWSIPGRIHYVLLTLAALAFTGFLYHWNLLGFHF